MMATYIGVNPLADEQTVEELKLNDSPVVPSQYQLLSKDQEIATAARATVKQINAVLSI